MAAPSGTLWKLDPHTGEKHLLLRRYLNAWVPILSHGGFPKAVYIDGFAGPGRYQAGEEGSPLIAMRAILDQRTAISTSFSMHFIELNKDRAAHLEEELKSLHSEYGRPSTISYTVHCTSFEAAYDKVRPELGASFSKVPAFAFLDPFGWKGLPHAIISDLLSRPSTEVFINFMFEEINRFLSHPEQVQNFNALFGGDAWKQCLSLSGVPRNECLRTRYEAGLRQQARYVRNFEMRNANNATDYFLFFATNNIAGLKKMKAAMWSSDQLGEFSFSDATDPHQIVLFDEPDFRPLREKVRTSFAGRTVGVEPLETFLLEETAFRETHLRKQVLAPLEDQGKIRVEAKSGRKRGQFPRGTRIAFDP